MSRPLLTLLRAAMIGRTVAALTVVPIRNLIAWRRPDGDDNPPSGGFVTELLFVKRGGGVGSSFPARPPERLSHHPGLGVDRFGLRPGAWRNGGFSVTPFQEGV
jgi:hypothetical protein